MAHSYVDYGGKYVLMRDAQIQLVVYAALAARALYEKTGKPLNESVNKLLDQCAWSIVNSGPGCIHLKLDQFLQSVVDREQFIALVKTAKDILPLQLTFVDTRLLKAAIELDCIPLADRIESKHFINSIDEFLSVFSSTAVP